MDLIPMIIGYVVATLGLIALVMPRLKIDLTPGRYKVIFHEGCEPTLKTKMPSGWLMVEQGNLQIVAGGQTITVPLASLSSVELFRLHGSMRMIRTTHDQGMLFVTVVRFCVAGQFAVGDFFKTASWSIS